MIILFAIWCLFYGIPAFLLRIPSVQLKAKEKIVSEITQLLNNPVSIEKVGIRWPDRIALEGVSIKDKDKPALEIKRLLVDVKILPLLKGRFVCTTLRLFDFSLSLGRETPQSPLNVQSMIDAFSKRDTTEQKSSIDLSIQSILIRRGHVSYDVDSEERSPGAFNAQHLDVGGINGHISLSVFNSDSINARIKRLSMTEGSGFELKNLSLKLSGNSDNMNIEDFNAELPRSLLKIGRAGIDLRKGEAVSRNPLSIDIAESEICPADLSAFIPALSNFKDRIQLSATAEGNFSDFELKNVTLRKDNDMLLVAKMQLKGITNPSETYLFGEVSRMFINSEGMQSLSDNLSATAVKLPAAIRKLGTVSFTGSISGFFDNLVAYGKISSGIGSIETDVLIGSNREKNIEAYIRGKLSSSELQINELFEDDNPFGTARFNISIDATRMAGKAFEGNVSASISELDYRNYRYENILLSGRFKPDGFNGKFEVDDPNGSLAAEGIFTHNSKSSHFDFSARLSHIRPDNLNLMDRLESPDISALIRADFRGSNIDDIEGSFSIDNLNISTTPRTFFLKHLSIAALRGEAEKQLTVESDLVNGEISGIYSFTTLFPGFMQTLNGYLPALVSAAKREQKMQAAKENNFSLLFTVENTEELSSTLKLPASISKQAKITGHYNNVFEKFRIEANVPGLRFGDTQIEECTLVCENPLDRIAFRLDAFSAINSVRNRINLSATARDNSIETSLEWENNKERSFKATLSAKATFMETMNGNKPVLSTRIHINKSPLVLNDSIWQIHESDINIAADRIDVRHFNISHNDQFLRMNGAMSKNVDDTLNLDLNRVELSYIFDILNIPILQFGGEASGRFQANGLYDSERIIKTELLKVDDFSFNHVKLGQLRLQSNWNEAEQGIFMNGKIAEGDSAGTLVRGYIYPVGAKEGLDLRFDANNLNIAFIQEYIDGVVSGFKGRGTGNIRLFGSFSDVDLEGKAYVKGGGLGIDFLNTYYTLSDSVHLKSGEILLRNTLVYDADGNTARVKEAAIRHNYLHDLEFNADIDNVNNFLVYNVTEKKNPMLYGKIYASGRAAIKGNDNLINFDIGLISKPQTAITINLMGSSTATVHNFITFVDKKKEALKTDTASEPSAAVQSNESDAGTELRMNIQVDVTPDAHIEMVMDPTAGDRIRGSGTGNLLIEYGTRTDLKMYGNLNIENGDYNFSLQQFFRKNFKIREGSSVSFAGDPNMAHLDIKAVHNVIANIGDLDPALLDETPRTNVSVNCILLLKGVFNHPTIGFDIELPGSNSDLERMVRSYINTEDMLTRQIVYLLAINTFHPSSFGQGLHQNEFNALTSAAISSQISEMLNAITDKVQIGANIRASKDYYGYNETEVEMLLSSQMFDNRLIFNGNFGYKNNINVKNVFVGEFDVEYLLTPGGAFRLKAYNHANDMYRYLKQSLTTQGFGFMYKKDFSNLHELFGIKPKPVVVQSESE